MTQIIVAAGGRIVLAVVNRTMDAIFGPHPAFVEQLFLR
jgi:hypothetical protein